MCAAMKVVILYIALVAASIQLGKGEIQSTDKANATDVAADWQSYSSFPSSCVDAYNATKGDGVYTIYIPNSWLEPFDVYCLKEPYDAVPWTVFQRRVDCTTDFFRYWIDYKYGFGNLWGNFFIGLDRLHAMTSLLEPQELWVKLVEGTTAVAKYSRFIIGNEYEKYAIKKLGSYSGSAGDSLRPAEGMKFSTRDADNDIHKKDNCAAKYKGAWWFRKCMKSHLNGVYGSTEFGVGINWDDFRGPRVSMKYAHMAIRPARY